MGRHGFRIGECFGGRQARTGWRGWSFREISATMSAYAVLTAERGDGDH
jgi:hypothetical protein